MLVDA
jgi:triosephosphate isomerase